MVLILDCFTALVLCSLTVVLQAHISGAADQPCGFVLDNADFGVVRPDVDALAYSACSWRISASTGRRLVINLDHVYLFDENASLTITLDGNETIYSNIKCNEWKHSQMVGNVIQIVHSRPGVGRTHVNNLYNSTSPSSQMKSRNLTALLQGCAATHFEVRYQSFNPLECEAAAAPVNGIVTAGKGRGIGEEVQYQCHTPYVLEEGSVATASCVSNSNTLMPLWSNPPPSCILPECGKAPIKIPLGDSKNKTILVLEDLKFEKLKNCIWEITAEGNRYLEVRVENLSFPTYATKHQDGATLELYDDVISERRLLARLNGGTGSSNSNYTTAFNRVIISLQIGKTFAFVQEPPSDSFNEMEAEIRHYGFTISVSSMSTSCKFPKAPVHGDVKGAGQSNSDSKDSKAVPRQAIAFSCNNGFYLNGSEHMSCLENGQWSDHVPICALRLLADELGTHSWEPQTMAVESETNVSVATEETIVSGKMQQSRISKDRRPHPQSTEEKTNLKGIKEDSNIKHSFVNPHTTSTEITVNFTEDVFSEDDVSSSGGVFPESPSTFDEFDEAFSNYENLGEAAGDDFTEDDVVRDSGTDSREFPVIAIILGVGIPLIFAIVAIGAFFVYRKLYPVRMSLGRKFETFENPAYGRGKRSPGTPSSGTLLPGASLAQSPAELQRLTREPLP